MIRLMHNLSYFLRILRIKKVDVDISDKLLKRSQALFEKDRLDDEVLTISTQAIIFNPWNAYAYCHRGTARAIRKSMRRGLIDLSIAIFLEPDNPMFHINRAGIFLAVGKHSQALVDLERAESLGVKDPPFYSQKGIALKGVGKLQEALLSFRTAERLGINHSQFHQKFAETLLEIEDYKGAQKHFKKALKCAQREGKTQQQINQIKCSMSEIRM